ncbi:hypothetical protein MEQ_03210 [Candida albicans P87]|nr:hypothetical protein MEQ_03210 [Candida albicans P87]
MSIEEEISEDLGFKLDIKDNGIPLFEPLDLQNLATKHLKLLAIHDDLMVASNSKCIKVVSLKNLDDITTIEGEFSITQLHFVGNELFVLDDSKIKSLTVEQLKNKDYSFRTIREGFVDILPSPSGILALNTNNELYLNADKVASNVSAFCWTSSSYIYASKDKPYHINNKKIKVKDVDELRIVEMFAINEKYLFVAYDTVDAELDYHDVKSYILEETDNDYTALEADIAPAFGSVARAVTYYHAQLSDWYKSNKFVLLTSSLAIDLGILDTTKGQTPKIIAQSEDINRAQFPIDDESGDDCSPVGFGVSLNELTSKVLEPCPGADEVTGVLPRIYTLLHTGNLISWWVFHKSAILKKELSLENAIKASSTQTKEVSNEPAQTKSNPFGNTPSSVFSAPASKSAFGQTGFGGSEASSGFGTTGLGQKPEATSAFGTTGLGQKVESKSGSGNSAVIQNPQATSAFGTTGFGQKPQATSAFGTTGFGQKAQTNSAFGSSGFAQKPQASSAFAQSSGSPFSGFAKSGSTSSGFAKLGSGGPSIFGDKTSSPVSTPLADESKESEEESEISLPEESDYSDEEELATDDANTSKDLEEVEGENVTETQEEKVETEIPPPTDPKPVQFSFFSGFTRISKPSSNEIKNKIINIIESTEGNLQVMDANRNQLGDFIGQHEKIDKGIDSLKFAEARVPLRDTTETLKRELLELTNLSTKIQKCFGEKVKLDRLYSQLALAADQNSANKDVLKSRPLDFKNDLMQTKLREKLNNVRSLEKKVLALLMPIKAKNSMDDQTIDNIERIVFQINEQILDHSVGIDDLATQMGELDIEGDKKVDVLSNCSKLKLRQKLRQKSIMF